MASPPPPGASLPPPTSPPPPACPRTGPCTSALRHGARGPRDAALHAPIHPPASTAKRPWGPGRRSCSQKKSASSEECRFLTWLGPPQTRGKGGRPTAPGQTLPSLHGERRVELKPYSHTPDDAGRALPCPPGCPGPHQLFSDRPMHESASPRRPLPARCGPPRPDAPCDLHGEFKGARGARTSSLQSKGPAPATRKRRRCGSHLRRHRPNEGPLSARAKRSLAVCKVRKRTAPTPKLS